MADNLSVTISANSGEFRAGLALAESAMRDFNRQLTAAARSARTAGDELSMSKLGAAAAQWERQTAVVAGLKSQMDGVTRSFGLNRAGMMEMQAAGVNSFQALASGMDVFRVASMEGAQVLGALIQGGILPSTGAMGGMAAAAAAVVVPLGFLAYQAYLAKQSLNSMSTELLLTGRLGGSGLVALDKIAEELASKFNLSKRAAAELLETIAKAHPLTVQQIRDVAELAAAEAAVRDQDPSKTAKKFAETLQSGAKGAIALAASYNLATTAAEHMLKSGDETGAITRVLADIKKHIDDHGGAWAVARARYLEYINSLSGDALAAAAGTWLAGGGSMVQQLGTVPRPTDKPSGGTGLEFQGSLQRMIAAAKEAGFEIGITSGTRSTERQAQLWAEALKKYGSPEIARKWVAPPGTSMHEKGLAADLSFGQGAQQWAAQNAGKFGLNFPLGNEPWHVEPVGARETGQNAIEAKAQNELAIRNAQDDFARRETMNRHSLAIQAEEARKHYEELKSLAGGVENDPLVEAAYTTWLQKKAQLFDQETQREISKLKEAQAAATDPAERTAIQRRIIGVMESRRTPEGLPAFDAPAMDSARTELASMVRQQGQQGFNLAEQGASAMRQARADMLRGYQAEREELVKIGGLSPFTALAQELEKSKSLAAENAVGLSTLMDGAKSVADQTKVYWEQWREGIRASTEAQQILKRVAAESKELMEKWAAPVKSALDRVGSSFESAIGGLLTGEKTIGDARSEIGKAATQGLASAGLGLLSKAGGAALGSTTGQGIGDVIGEKITSTLFGTIFESGAQVANTTALATNTAAIIANTAAVGGAAATTAASATAGAASGGAGGIGSIFGGIASVLGWVFGPLTGGASAVAGSAIGTGIGVGTGGLYRRGGIVPSAAGGWALPSFPGMQPAMLHAREMVLPDGEMPSSIEKRLSAMITNLGGGGGAGPVYNSFHISAFSPKDAVDAVNKAMRLGGGRLRPA